MLRNVKGYWVQITGLLGFLGSLLSGVFYAGHRIAELEHETRLLKIQIEVLRKTNKAVVRYVAATMFSTDDEAQKFIQRFDAEVEEVFRETREPVTTLRWGAPVLIVGGPGGKRSWRAQQYIKSRQELLRLLDHVEEDAVVEPEQNRINVQQCLPDIPILSIPKLPVLDDELLPENAPWVGPSWSVSSTEPSTSSTRSLDAQPPLEGSIPGVPGEPTPEHISPGLRREP